MTDTAPLAGLCDADGTESHEQNDALWQAATDALRRTQ